MRIRRKHQKRSVLWRNVILLSLLLLFPICSMLYFVLRIGTENLLEYTQNKEVQLLSNYTNGLDSNLITVDNLTNQLLFDNDVMTVLASDPAEPDYVAIKSVLLNIERMYYSNRFIESIYLFDSIHPYILSDAMIYKKDFLDSAVLDEELYTTTGLKPLRTVDRSTAVTPKKPVTLLSYVKQVYNHSAGTPVTIIVNVYPEAFATLSSTEHTGSFFIVDSSLEPLYQLRADEVPEKEIFKEFSSLASGQENSRTSGWSSPTIHKEKYFLCYEFLPDFGLYTLSVQNYTYFTDSIIKTTGNLAIPFVIIILISILAILFVSYLLYRPLQQLLQKFEIPMHLLPQTNQPNEYYLLSNAMSNLYEQKRELEQQYTITRSYAETYSLHEFLIAPEFNKDDFLQLCSTLKLTLEHPFFYLLLLKFKQPIPKEIRKSFSDTLSRLVSDSFYNITITDPHNLTVLLNTSLSAEAVLNAASHLKQEFTDKKYTAIIGVSICFDEIEPIPAYYNEALKKLREQPFTALNQAEIIDLNPEKNNGDASYPKPSLDVLLTKIAKQDRDGVLCAALDLFEPFTTVPENNYLYLKYLVFEIENSVYKHVASLGGVYDNPEYNNYQLYRRIRETDDLFSLKHNLLSFLEYSLDILELKSQRQHSDIIGQVLQFIEENYSSDISVVDMAEYVHLSPNYLSNLFKAERNETLLETLTTVRMENAKKLLDDPSLRIKDVASMVGYNTVQSFIRYFKKYYHVTPEQWRKINQ